MPNESKSFAVTYIGLWVFAALLHPLSQLVPTESGDPPKFFSFLIPLVFIALAVVSTSLIRKASRQDDTA